jgi:hypothetical protein
VVISALSDGEWKDLGLRVISMRLLTGGDVSSVIFRFKFDAGATH